MTKVYIVSSGSYSDYCIDGVFDTKEKAQAFIDSFGQYNTDINDIEEYDLNPPAGKAKGKDGMFAYCVVISERPGLRSCYAGESYEEKATNRVNEYEEHYVSLSTYDRTKSLVCYVFARDRDHAIKIALDRAREIKATVGWGNLIN